MRHLIERGVGQDELDSIRERARLEVQQAADRARAAPRPDAASVLDDVYRSPSLHAISG